MSAVDLSFVDDDGKQSVFFFEIDVVDIVIKIFCQFHLFRVADFIENFFVVGAESFQMKKQNIRNLFELERFERGMFLVVFFAEISVFIFQFFALKKLFEALFQTVRFVVDVEAQEQKFVFG